MDTLHIEITNHSVFAIRLYMEAESTQGNDSRNSL